MKTKALRLYGVKDLRLEEFELPEIKSDEIRAHIISDSICMSTYKASLQGASHKRVPDDIAENPVIVGHEFCGIIEEVGEKWKDKFKPGQKFAIQPALNYKGSLAAPGYSYRYIGGEATDIIIPNEVMETGSLLPYDGNAYFYGSLAEPMSCIIGAYHAQYHTTNGSYVHQMGIKEGGNLALFASAGPMGLGAIDYAIHGPIRPKLVVVTDIDDAKLNRAREILKPEDAEKDGVRLLYVNTSTLNNPTEELLALTDGKGFDDIFVYAPVKPVVELADSVLGRDGCLNFFAGPTDQKFSAMFNFYNVHYASTHIVGTSGGNTDDMKEALSLMERSVINPAAMITHVGGIDSAAETTLTLPTIPGGKKLIYTNINMPLTAITDFEKLKDKSPVYAKLAEIVSENNNLWCAKAEEYLLKNSDKLN